MEAAFEQLQWPEKSKDLFQGLVLLVLRPSAPLASPTEVVCLAARVHVIVNPFAVILVDLASHCVYRRHFGSQTCLGHREAFGHVDGRQIAREARIPA